MVGKVRTSRSHRCHRWTTAVSVGLARVTISAPQRRVDVALPEHVPLAELLPEVLRHAGEGLADDGEQHGGWVLRRTDGVAAGHRARAWSPRAVRDGEVLQSGAGPRRVAGAGVRRRGRGDRRGRAPPGHAWTPAATRTADAGRRGVLLALGLFAVLRGRAGVERRRRSPDSARRCSCCWPA